MTRLRSSAALLALLCTSSMALAQAGRSPSYIETQQVGVHAHIEVLGQAFTWPYTFGADQSRIMLYHTSLVPGAWNALCYRSGAAPIGARQMCVGSRPKDLADSITALQLQGGQTHYLRVQEEQGRPVLQPMPAAQRIKLPAVTLIAFNRSDAAGTTGAGLAAMDNLRALLKADFSRSDSLHVMGHADPQGNAQNNEALALQRARTVLSTASLPSMHPIQIRC